MANKIIIKRSSVAGKIPLSTDLEVGELAVNLVDKVLFTKNASGDVVPLDQDVDYYIKASSAITKGQVVMFTGAVGASGNLTGAPATGLTAETAYAVMGIAAADIALNDWGYVTAFGNVKGVDTSAFSDGQILYLNPSVAGGLTATIPTAPNPKVQVCAVANAASNGTLVVRPTFGGKLGQFEGDVQITSPTSGDALVWDGSKWANTQITGYVDADVDAHLNTATATTGQVLSWTGSDYDWVDQSGGGGGALTIQNKTSAYTVVAGDLGTIINCTSGTFTVSLTAAATLGAGFNVTIWNTSTTATNAITIDPSGAEKIDGSSTLVLRRGEGMQIVCDGTNWQTGNKKTMRVYAENFSNPNRPTASGNGSFAIGDNARATGLGSFALGDASQASGQGAFALGYNSPLASSSYASAIGNNSAGGGSQAVTGSGAMALGGSYASGTDSFAAAVANNTSSYGAKGANSIAMGDRVTASASRSVAIGSLFTVASGANALALGNSEATSTNAISICASNSNYRGTASANGAVAIGWGRAAASYPIAQAEAAIALQHGISSVKGKLAFGYDNVGWLGQFGVLNLRSTTTSATPATLTTDTSATADSTNQIILPNNSAYAFSILIVARQQAAGGTASAAWKIEGLIRREANAASTTLVNSATTVLNNDPGWAVAVSADTTNGGLAVTVTGAAATNIRWVATGQTSEVTYA